MAQGDLVRLGRSNGLPFQGRDEPGDVQIPLELLGLDQDRLAHPEEGRRPAQVEAVEGDQGKGQADRP